MPKTMTRKPMARTSMNRLNQIARRLERQGVASGQAVHQAATEFGLTLVKKYDQSGALYRSERGRYVFGWTNNGSLEAGDGFDDQIDDVE